MGSPNMTGFITEEHEGEVDLLEDLFLEETLPSSAFVHKRQRAEEGVHKQDIAFSDNEVDDSINETLEGAVLLATEDDTRLLRFVNTPDTRSKYNHRDDHSFLLDTQRREFVLMTMVNISAPSRLPCGKPRLHVNIASLCSHARVAGHVSKVKG